MKKVFISLLMMLFISQFYAQNYKFGKVSKEELLEKVYPLDATANAVVLYKKRYTSFSYMAGKGFLIDTEIHERIKIYNKEGYDWATKRVRLYTPKSGDKDDVSILDADTFVLENEKIESYKLRKSDIFNEQYNKYWSDEKFTMPNVVDGCVVEWRYKITSPYKSIDKVDLQLAIPIKKLECKIVIPEYYVYNVRQVGFETIEYVESSKNEGFTVSGVQRDNGNPMMVTQQQQGQRVDYRSKVLEISKDNMPALFEEPYVNDIDNYRSSLQFELSAVNWPNEPIKYYSSDWGDVVKTIYDEAEFGAELKKTSYFEDDLAPIMNANTDPSKLMSAIFEFVKKKVKWNTYRGVFTEKGVRSAYKDGIGNTADINLMLVAMLRAAKLTANPLVLSTRDHGIPLFPTINGFNYVIAAVEIGDKRYLLDATDAYAMPNVLPKHDLNFQGRIIKDDKTSEVVDLMATEPASTSTIMSVQLDDSASLSGFIRTSYTNLHALEYRNNYSKVTEETMLTKLGERYSGLEISEVKLSNKEDITFPITELFTFSANNSADIIGNKIYFKPLFFNSVSKSPFKLEKREFPIDYGTANSYTTRVSIAIPEGYKIESLPESVAFALKDNLGVFRYQVSKATETSISVYSSLQINSSILPSTIYTELKKFYSAMVDKNLERVVLVKI